MDKDFTDPKLIRRARELRQDRPEAEALLWSRLRAQQLGHKFRRQHPIGPFIADFACVPAMLVIEIDGKSHRDRQAEDEERTKSLDRLGWRVVRYTNLDVLNKLDAVVSDIARNLPSAAPT